MKIEFKTKRALLLGAPTPDLRGVEHDIELLSSALCKHGFTKIVKVCPAKRAHIVKSLDEFIAATAPGDVVVLYYSGHGSKIEPADAARLGIGEHSYYRFLVPSDFEKSTEQEFLGYTNVELSLALAKLTRKTKNVTAIMDCCFAGRVFRKSESETTNEVIEWQDTSRYQPTRYHESKGLWARSAKQYYEKLSGEGLGHDVREAEANPHAVLLLGSAASGRAYETNCRHKDCGYEAAGAMTLALHDALTKVDPEHTTWQDIGRMIRMTPRRTGHDQQVSIEGPHRRFLFSVDEREELGSIDVYTRNDRVLLVGGLLADLQPRDRYEFVAFDQRGSEKIIGVGEVDQVRSSFATVRSSLAAKDILSGTRARLIHFGGPRGFVELRGVQRDMDRELLEARIRAVGLTPVTEPKGESAIARVQVEDGKIRLFAGELGFDVPRTFMPSSMPTQARHLANHIAEGAYRLGRAATFANLERGKGKFDPGCEPSFGRVDEKGELHELRDGRPQLTEADAIAVRIQPRVAAFVSIYCIHPDARIELLSRAQGGGVWLEERETYTLGERSREKKLRGIELSRPARAVISSEEPLPYTILVLVTNKQVDLRCWAQRGIRRYVWTDPLKPASFARNALGETTPQERPALYEIYKYEFDLARAAKPKRDYC